MDPASAGIVFVGFAASLLTLASAAAQGLQNLHALCEKIEHAPEELGRLAAAVQTLESLLRDFKLRFQKDVPDGLPTGFGGLWQDSAKQMQNDLCQFEQIVSKFQAGLEGKSLSNRNIRARVRKYFSDDTIIHWERVLNAHIAKFTLLLTIITDARSILTLDQIKLQSHRLATLSEKTCSLPEFRDELHDLKRFQSIENQKLAALVVNCAAVSVASGWHIASTTRKSVGQPQTSRNSRLNQRSPFGLALGDERSLKTPGLQSRPISSSVTRHPRESPSPGINHDVKKLIYMTWSVYRFPIGILCITRSGKRMVQNIEDPSEEQELSFTFAPPSWLTAAIVTVSFTVHTMQTGAPGFRWSSSTTTWSQNPVLARYVFMCNISGLKRLFLEKKARPTDLLAPSGRTLLHVRIFSQVVLLVTLVSPLLLTRSDQEAVFAHLAQKPGSLDLCQFLINAGADLNARSLDGYTPILLCCYLMEQKIDSKPLQQLMVPLMDLLLSAGADPALCGGHDGLSTFSRLFAKISNFGYLESVIRRFVDASNFEDLNLFDTWILATLIRSDPKFYRSLEVQLLEFRTAPSLQTGARSQASLLTNLSLPRQVSEMQQSSSGYRIEFMRALSRHGTAAMLEPILNAGIDINEVNDTEFSYLGEAAKAGNYETLVALVNAGARVEGGTFLPAPDALLQRWVEMDMLFTEKQQRETIEAEFPLLEELIKTPGLRVESMPYTLSRALKVPNEICFKSVLDAGFGVSLRPKPGKQKHTSLFGPAWWELIEAVYLNNYPAVQLLIARGARLEDEDDVGCTALLTAVDNGRPEIIKLLVEAGARVHFRTRKTKSAWDLACKNLLTSHPRRINFDHRQMDHNVRYVPAEVDLQVYSILKKASPKEPKGCRSGSDLDEPYLVEAILDTLIKTRAELSFEYAAIKKSLGRISASTITLVILGLAVTIPVLIIHEAWTGAWRIYRTRSSPAFGQWGALLLIMCFAWWATPSLGQGH